MDYHKLAQELLETDKPVMLNGVQLAILEAEVEALPEGKRTLLEHDGKDNPSHLRTQVIDELKENAKLMLILSLGMLPTNQLIGCLALFISGNYDFEIVETDKGFEGRFVDKVDDDFETILDFLDATVPYGTPTLSKENSDIYVDGTGTPIAEVYYDILASQGKSVDDGVWLKIDSSNFETDTPTNDYLLQHIADKTDEEIAETFGDELYTDIIEYFNFWLGPDFRDFAEVPDF